MNRAIEMPPIHGEPALIYAPRELDVPRRFNFVDSALRRNVAEHPDKAAYHFVRADGAIETTSWAGLDERVNRLGAGMQASGVAPGDRVLVGFRESLDLIACVLATIRIGAITVPFSPMARRRELAELVARVRPRGVIVDVDAAAEAEPLRDQVGWLVQAGAGPDEGGTLERIVGDARDLAGVDTGRDDHAVIFQTGGTTGRPKLCVHSHRALAAQARLATRYNYQLSAADVICSVGPAVHAFGFLGKVEYPLLSGASSVLMEQVSGASLALTLERLKVTHLVSGSTLWGRLLLSDPPPDLSSVRYLESIVHDEPVYARLEGMGLRPRNSFGMVPTNGYITMVGHGEPSGSLGVPLPGYEMYVVSTDKAAIFDERGNPVELDAGEIGRLALRGPVGIRYVDDPEQAEQDVVGGWSLLDDVFERDPDGYLWWRGRLSNVIKTSGYSVGPIEVEDVLKLHPSVCHAAVFGTPDPVRGDVVTAVVQLRPGWTASDTVARELQEHVKSLIAPYKYPRLVEFVDVMPTDQLGKVRYGELKQALAATRSS